jgi:membrane protease YdiL (CAAX protease family)
MHAIPFIVWMLLMSPLLGDPSGTHYAVQTVGGLLALLFCRPWRWYASPQLKNLPLAVAVGLLVFVFWVGLESEFFKTVFPRISEFYERWLVDLSRIGKLREPLDLDAQGLYHYDPRVTGWPLFWIHMFGTTLIIGAVEEFFFRGLVYRWMQGSPFFQKDIGRLDSPMCLLVSLLFAVEHREWLMGFLCGLLFTWLMVRTRDIWAAIWAHAVTNGLLGWYAVHTGAWWFW